MSRLVEFYRGRATDAGGRFQKDLWEWDDSRLETVHDFIQWLFPLPEPSRFSTETADGGVVEGPNLMSRAADVWSWPNHNWLRITRMLRSLRLLGLEADARAVYDRLDAFFRDRRFPISEDTFRYWAEAVHGPGAGVRRLDRGTDGG